MNRTTGHLRSMACLLGASGLLAGGAAVRAQTANAPADTDTDALQEVVVTAERRTQNIQTTPIAISAISGDQLRSQQLNTVTDLQRSVPNVQVLDAGPYQSINIRGIGNTAITPSIVPGVSVTHDGLLSPETIFIGEPFYDIADVEVLRGPQGTLVGASSTGGAVQINSQNPNFRGLNGYAEALAGNYNDQRITGAVNLPITDTLAARVAINWEQRGSFYQTENTLLGAPAHVGSDPGRVDNHNARIGLLWKPNDNFEALLKVSYNYSNTDGTAGEPNQYTFQAGPGQTCPDRSAGPICHSLYYNYSTHVPFLLNYSLPSLIGTETEDRAGLDMKYTFADGIQLRSLTGVQHLDGGDQLQDDDYSSAAAQIHQKDVGPNDNYYSQEFSLQSPSGGTISWIAGALYFYRRTPVENTSYIAYPYYSPAVVNTSMGEIPQGALGTEISQSATATNQRTQGIYGNIDWNITSTLQLQAGLRGNWDENYTDSPDTDGFQGAPPGTGTVIQLPITTGVPCPLRAGYSCLYVSNIAQQHDSEPTGKVDLNWTVVPGQYLYAFYARGYKSGGIVVHTTGFKPEIVDDYEAGWKTELLDDHIHTALGGYWMMYHDMQLPILNPATGTNAVTNIPAKSTIRGIEFSADARFGGFGSNFTATFDNSKIGAVSEVANFRLPPNATNLPQCVGTAAPPLCFNYAPYLTNLSGEQNPYTPKFTANLTLDYKFELGDIGAVTPSVNYQYTGHQYTSIFQIDNYYLLTARHLINASLTYNNGPWEAEAFCNNISNLTYVAGSGGVSVGDVWYYGAPRQFGVRVARSF